MLSWIVLALLATTAGFGLLTLLRWLRSRRPGSPFPTRLVVAHVGSVLVALALWITHLSTDRTAYAWAALGVVLLANGLGDLVLAGNWRRTSTVRGTLLGDYAKAVVDLKNPRRRTSGAHLVLAGVTTLTLLVATIVASG